jgi:nickel-type superoxide dismutase maturation protease
MGRIRRARGLAALVVATISVAPWLARLIRSWPRRVAVEGPSMGPALRPGDWLLVDPLAYRDRAPVVGDVVVAVDPRDPGRLLVKRVHHVGRDGLLELRGDAPEASTDSRTFGPLPSSAIHGRAWVRYWPLARVGRVR